MEKKKEKKKKLSKQELVELPLKAEERVEPKYIPKAKDLQVVKTIAGDFNEFKKLIYQVPSVLIIIGKKNSGKTALGTNLFETLIAKTGRVGYTVFFPKELPNFCTQVNFIELVPNDCIAFIDEAGIVLPSGTTTSKKQQYFNNLMMTAYHQNLIFVFTVQNTSNISINTLRQADALIIKEPGLFQTVTERPFVRKLCAMAREEFNKIDKKERKKYAYVISDDFIGIVKNSLPSFWTQEIRKGFRRQI